MKRIVRVVSTLMVGMGLALAGVVTARAADDLCAMGGAMIKAEINKDKALAWAKDLRRVEVAAAETDAWSVLTLSRTNEDIAVLVAPGYVFFAVAGRGGEVYPRDFDKAFGKDRAMLREAVRKVMGDLWKAGVAKIEGQDVQQLADAAGLGVLERQGRGWTLTPRDCQAVGLDTSGL